MPMDVLKTYHNKLKNGEKHYQISEVKSPTHSLIIAKEILNEIKNGIFEIKYYASGEEPIRDNFDFTSHFGEYKKSSNNEKPLCRSWFNDPNKVPNCLKKYGTIIDYECSLLEKKNDKTNIDLVSFSNLDGQSIFYLWEVKGGRKVDEENKTVKYSSSESLLRAVLEIETYYQTLLKNGVIDNFKQTIGAHLFNIDNRLNSMVKKIVVVPNGSKAAEQINDETIMEIAKELNIEVVCFDAIQPKIDLTKLIDKNRKNL